MADDPTIDISVVIPVYSGSATLGPLIAELSALTAPASTPGGRRFRVGEVLLVWDRGPGGADRTIRELAAEHSWVRPVWLSRNFGQHAATLAGMSSSGGRWVATMDEDGQHDPAYLGAMLDAALDAEAQLVYASPIGARPHGALRNAGSAMARSLFRVLVGGTAIDQFHSYRLILGEVARGTAAYTGPGVYLDVALSWVVASVATCPVPMRTEGRPASNYSMGRLFSHFGRLVISSGTRPLALVSVLGMLFFVAGVFYSLWVLFQRMFGEQVPAGWTSSFIATLIIGGLTLFSLGIIAQYLRATVNMSLGKPLYVVVRDPRLAFPPDGDRR